MSSSKHWALYATNRRVGQWEEHRLAGARLGAVGVSLTFEVRNGWVARAYVGRLHIETGLALAKADWRRKAFWEHIMPPTVVAKLTQSISEVETGRGYRWSSRDDGRSVPLATWRADDPKQPDGWHHDGKRWVLNEDGGWFQDRGGHWRYNKPGDPGWRQLEDGSWRYDAAEPTDRPR